MIKRYVKKLIMINATLVIRVALTNLKIKMLISRVIYQLCFIHTPFKFKTDNRLCECYCLLIRA